MTKNVAVILAGGSGSRLMLGYPKQYFKVAGKMVIEHTLDAFQSHADIDEIAIVCGYDYVHNIEDVVIRNQYSKVRKILTGGKQRYESSLAAINAYDDPDTHLIFHDAVRPLVSARIISDCVSALEKYNAVDVVIPTTDTIVQAETGGDTIHSIPVRSRLRNGQTPQAFRLGTLKKAYEIALRDPDFSWTDDCGVIVIYLTGEPGFLVRGALFNLKLTYNEDLFLLDKLFQLKTAGIQTETLTDVAAKTLKDKVIVVFGGSGGIGASIVKVAKEAGARIHACSRLLNDVDVSNHEKVCRALNEVYRKEGRIDHVIVTAGLLVKEPISFMSYEKMRQMLDVNLLGSCIVAKESFRFLSETRGSLLLFTSSSYTQGRAMYSLYSATKAAIVNFVQALNEEWRGFGVRINCMNPERTKTPMRISNFGNEPDETLLTPETVAVASLNVVMSEVSGEVIDVKRRNLVW